MNDPLGFVSPVTVQLRIFFQVLCKTGISWDQPLSGELLKNWWKITTALTAAAILVERCYFTIVERESDVTTFSIQGFCNEAVLQGSGNSLLRIVFRK